MAGSNYQLRRLREDEMVRAFWFICARGKYSLPGLIVGHHEVRPTFEFSFECVRAGRVVKKTSKLCETHAREVAAKYQIAWPAAGSSELVEIEQGRLDELLALERASKN